jgi:hypothetical protein
MSLASVKGMDCRGFALYYYPATYAVVFLVASFLFHKYPVCIPLLSHFCPFVSPTSCYSPRPALPQPQSVPLPSWQRPNFTPIHNRRQNCSWYILTLTFLGNRREDTLQWNRVSRSPRPVSGIALFLLLSLRCIH